MHTSRIKKSQYSVRRVPNFDAIEITMLVQISIFNDFPCEYLWFWIRKIEHVNISVDVLQKSVPLDELIRQGAQSRKLSMCTKRYVHNAFVKKLFRRGRFKIAKSSPNQYFWSVWAMLRKSFYGLVSTLRNRLCFDELCNLNFCWIFNRILMIWVFCNSQNHAFC